MPDIFLSYTREDQATAQRFAEAFEAQGFSVWWDVTLRSGEAYDQVTEDALRTAKAVVVLWSQKSVVSRWVRAEATLAARNRTLIPAMIELCERPVMFELTHTADLTHWSGGASDPAWRAFLSDLQRKIGDAPAAGAAPVLAAAAAPVTTMSRSGPAVVAFLPIAHRAGDQEMGALAEELTEEITRELAQNSLFEVVATGAIAGCRGGAVDYRAVGRELGLHYLVEGKLQPAGEELRLNAQLIDAATGRMVKPVRFARRLAEFADSPEAFSVEVAAQLGEVVVQTEMDRAMNKPSPYSGWEHVLRALAYYSRVSSDSLRMATEEARGAVAIAPDLGVAHAVLAATLAVPVVAVGEELTVDLKKKIQMHARRAMQLDGDNPAVIDHLITANTALDEREANLQLAERLTELLPNSPLAILRLGSAYLSLGRSADGIAVLAGYDRVAPFGRYRATALFSLGACHFLEGDPTEAEAALDRALALYPDFSMALMWKAIVAASNGDEQGAIAAFRRFREIETSRSLDHALRHVARLRHGRSAEVLVIVRRLWKATEAKA